MARRQKEVLRNLDTPLKALGLITVKSLGIVMFYLAFSYALDMVSFWHLIAGKRAFIVHIGSVLALAFVLVYIEREEDEHLALAAIRYFVTERIAESWLRGRRYVYSGLAQHRYVPHKLEEIFK